jgi:hypothetical protein
MRTVIACRVRLSRGWAVACVLAILIGGSAVWQVLRPPPARPGDSITLAYNRVTFRMPAGWRRMSCAEYCMYLRTPRGANVAISVLLVTPQPVPIATGPNVVQTTAVERDLDTVAGARHFVIDGVPFVVARFDAEPARAEPATTLVSGRLRDGWIRVSCLEWSEPELVRAGCDIVVGSLHLHG